MKVNIGPKGKVIGTKRVSATGQVAGLKDLAGKNVLILYPRGKAMVQPSIRERAALARREFSHRVERLPKDLRAMRKGLREPSERVKSALGSLSPASTRAAIDGAQDWFALQARHLNRRAAVSRRMMQAAARKRIERVGAKVAAARANVEKRLGPMLSLN